MEEREGSVKEPSSFFLDFQQAFEISSGLLFGGKTMTLYSS